MAPPHWHARRRPRAAARHRDHLGLHVAAKQISALAAPAVHRTRDSEPARRGLRVLWRWVLIGGVLNYGAFTVFTALSLVWLDASQAVVITYTLPVWASLLAWPALGEGLTLRHVMAIRMALGGVALLVGSVSLQSALSKRPGVLSGFAAAGLFGLGTVVAMKRPLAMPPVAGIAWQALFGALLVAALALFEHPDWSQLNTTGIPIFGWIG